MLLQDPKDFLKKVKKPSKEEKVEAERQRALVKEIIYPIFLKNAKSIREARTICKNFVVAMDAAFYMGIQKEQKRLSSASLTELDMQSVMNKGIENSAEWLLMQALQGEKVAAVKGLIEGLEREIQRLVEKDIVDKPLAELKTEFL